MWKWKDERSFAEQTGDPTYWSATRAAAIPAEGVRVARLVEAGPFPFDGSWCDYRPPPAWTPPPLPASARRTVLRAHP